MCLAIESSAKALNWSLKGDEEKRPDNTKIKNQTAKAVHVWSTS